MNKEKLIDGLGALSVHWPSLWSKVEIKLDGKLLAFRGKTALLDAATQKAVNRKGAFYDPIPKLEFQGVTHEFMTPLTWYDHLFILLPISLLAVGGLVGGILGAIAVIVNGRIIRYFEGINRYLMTIGITMTSMAIFLVLAGALNLIFFQR